jgi:imidazolonepropionase-like amidohydrolase
MKRYILLPFLMAFVFACNTKPEQAGPQITAFINFTLIDGSGALPLASAVMLVSDGRITAIGPKDQVQVPTNATSIDLKGKYVIPGLINAHGHVGDVKGIDGGHYSAANVIDNLAIYARYGITTVVSLGNDKKEAEPVRSVNDTTSSNQHARLFIAGDVIGGKTPEEAVAVVDSNHAMGVDWMKIRVDDNLGTSPKMSEEVYTAVIKRSHELGYKIASHMYYLDDAKKLLAAGSDLMAHSVRDVPVDADFINAIKDKKVCYCPTLTRELSTFVYGETPEFFQDPFFTGEYDSTIVAPLKDTKRQEQIRNSISAQTYRKQLPVAMANLKTLSDQGVPIAFGTDSGIPTRFIGYFEHIELSMMAQAGMSPMQIIISATKNAADCMGLKDVGQLTVNRYADFVVLNDDPLANIGNVSKIEGVWMGGVLVDGIR